MCTMNAAAEEREGGRAIEPLYTWAELEKRWGCKRRTAERIAANIGLKPLPLGHKVKRFRAEDVRRCEARLARKMNIAA